jgi:hypothetical protein
MWVRFLDKVNSGTLFNFGNPLRNPVNDPRGFALETFIVEKESYADYADGAGYFNPPETFSGHGFFNSGDVERFVRLVVRESDDTIRDSHVGNVWMDRVDTVGFSTRNDLDSGVSPFNYTRIPIDFSEWYYIVATYNPGIVEDVADLGSAYINNPDYWRWNWTGTEHIANSGLGARCKVEIISRPDLMRARGFKP